MTYQWIHQLYRSALGALCQSSHSLGIHPTWGYVGAQWLSSSVLILDVGERRLYFLARKPLTLHVQLALLTIAIECAGAFTGPSTRKFVSSVESTATFAPSFTYVTRKKLWNSSSLKRLEKGSRGKGVAASWWLLHLRNLRENLWRLVARSSQVLRRIHH